MSSPDRTFARVTAHLKGHLRVLSAGQASPLFSGLPTEPTRLRVEDDSGLPESVLRHIQVMDEKLTAILMLLSQQRVEKDFPIPVTIHDISGAGLRFSAPQIFSLGTDIEVVVELGLYPLGLTGTLGSIVRQDTEAGQDLWAMKFTDMRAAEREKIVQFVLARQRDEIRNRATTACPIGEP